jgi:vacuolar-type H+-ATPase subunit F/Vma7
VALVACNIAVIGNSDSIEYFRVLGCRTYETEEGELTEEQFTEVVECRFKIILVTEEVFHKYKDLIQRRTQRTFPVVSVIPDIHGAVWEDGVPKTEEVAIKELSAAVIRAVGQDISSSGT